MEAFVSSKIMVKLITLDPLIHKSLFVEARAGNWIDWAELVGEGEVEATRDWKGWNPDEPASSSNSSTLSSSDGIEGNKSWLLWGKTWWNASCKKNLGELYHLQDS